MSKDITWEELCKKAKEMGYSLYYDDHYEMCEELDKNGLCFFENGKIKTDINDVVSEDKSFNQMLAIMEALR